MHRVVVLSLLIAAGLSLGCPRNAPEVPAGFGPELLSRVDAADPRAEAQLLEGLHPLEQRSWRWTAKKFVVSLATPQPAPDLPVELALRFTLPDVIVETLGPITITARIEGAEVGSRRYEQSGIGLVFDVEVPDRLLSNEKTVIEFELDKSMFADESPRRELGIVFLSAVLQ
jgi:hypothetical protein